MAKPYDPKKAHAYYERTKHLKGRHKGTSHLVPGKGGHSAKQAAQARVHRIKGYISTLKTALSETEQELSTKRQSSARTAAANSDGKTTVKERTAAKNSRDKHQAATKSTSTSSSSSSSSGSSGSSKSSSSSSKASSTNTSDMDAQMLRARATQLRSALRDARQQLSNASKELGQLAHSEIISDPNINERFARFKSAERIP